MTAETRLIEQRYSTPTATEPSDQSVHSDKVVVDAERAIEPTEPIFTTSELIKPIQVSERTQAPKQVNPTAAAPEAYTGRISPHWTNQGTH